MKSRQDLRRIAPLALAAVAVTDLVARRRCWSRPVAGVLDEIAHLGTGAIVLSAFPRPDRSFSRELLAASVLLDVDHVPDALGWRALRPRRMRPVPHSVATLLALACSPRLDGAFVGVSAHLVRDLATGTNSVPLLWPFSRRPFSIRYRTYAAGLTLLAAQSLIRLGASTPRVAPLKSTTDGAEAST
jgi:membrane-bound metal-dependent hydrolase YbcI (DUF457 family)